MARNIQPQLEAEATHKGLTGEERARYIGGAWQHIREGTPHRNEADRRHLSRAVGEVHEIRHVRQRHSVAFRQGEKWYELPRREFHELVSAGREEEERARRAAAEYERGRRVYERELARGTREEERQRKREAREGELRGKREAREREAMQRQLTAVRRAAAADVARIIRERGGIRATFDKTTGRQRDRGEYATLPARLRASTRQGAHDALRGLSLDDAAREVHTHMPWLGIEGPRELLDYLDNTRTHRGAFTRRRAA